MFTAKFFIRDKSNSLKLRITLNRKSTEISVPGVTSTPEDFANAHSDKPLARNARLAKMLKQWEAQISNLRFCLMESKENNLTLPMLRDRITEDLFGERNDENKSDCLNWEKYYEGYVESKKNRSYRESCQYTLKKMRELRENFSELKFDDITLKWLKDFDESLIDTGASQNTRNIHFKNIRTCLNRAIDEELTNNYPFRRFKIKAEETRKRNLPVEELRRLFDYAVEPHQELYRDMFKLIFLLIGINTIDLYSLKEVTKDGYIEYRRAKTHKLYKIKVEPEAMEIINRYKGTTGLLSIADRWKSHRDFQKFCNIELKKIGSMERVGRGGKKVIKSEWPELSTYWARHSWATIAADIDVPDAVISCALGHSTVNPTTGIYIDRNKKKVDEANRRVIDWVFYGKR